MKERNTGTSYPAQCFNGSHGHDHQGIVWVLNEGFFLLQDPALSFISPPSFEPLYFQIRILSRKKKESILAHPNPTFDAILGAHSYRWSLPLPRPEEPSERNGGRVRRAD